MEKKYFLVKGKRKDGPFTIHELEKQDFNKNSMVWYEGLTDWQLLTNIDELKYLIKVEPSSPPPTPFEVNESKRLNVYKIAIKQSFICLLLVASIAFVILGGFSSDINLKSLYPNKGPFPNYADANELRMLVIPTIGLLFIGLPTSILFLIFKVRSLKKKI